jgi:methylmalonyl-CoA mutase
MPSCALYFELQDDVAFNVLTDFVESKSMEMKINGAFFQKNMQPGPRLMRWKNFHSLGIIVRENENLVDEIVDSLLTVVELVEHNVGDTISADQVLRSIAFSISVDSDFFLSIAKIRALNNVWLLLQDAYQIKTHVPAFIHARSRPFNKEVFPPHCNMLKQTTAAMAAFLASCNALTVEPEDYDNRMMKRIALNVTSMLKDESHLGAVHDPLAGSFYIESLTNQIASEAWMKFQQR